MNGATPFRATALVALATSLIASRPQTVGAQAPVKKATERVIYRAGGTAGFQGWRLYGSYDAISGQARPLSQGLRVTGGALTFDGTGGLVQAVAPFHKTPRNFAVEATLRVDNSAQSRNAISNIFVRDSMSRAATGLMAGYQSTTVETTAHDVATISWNGQDRFQYLPGSPFTPDTAFHIYRLEVRGNLYRFLIDRHEAVPWSAIHLTNPSNELGLRFEVVPAALKSFKVIALSSGSARSQQDTIALLKQSLPQSSVNLTPHPGIFRPNALYAADNKVDATTLTQWGRVFGYLQTYENTTSFVSQSVNVHRSPAGAKAAFDHFAANFQPSTMPSGSQVLDASGIGDAAYAFSYQYTYAGAPSYVTQVLFQRSAYYVALKVDSADPAFSHNALNLARQADTLVRGL